MVAETQPTKPFDPSVLLTHFLLATMMTAVTRLRKKHYTTTTVMTTSANHRNTPHLQVGIHHQRVVRRALQERAFFLGSRRRCLGLFFLLRLKTVGGRHRYFRCVSAGGKGKSSRKRGQQVGVVESLTNSSGDRAQRRGKKRIRDQKRWERGGGGMLAMAVRISFEYVPGYVRPADALVSHLHQDKPVGRPASISGRC